MRCPLIPVKTRACRIGLPAVATPCCAAAQCVALRRAAWRAALQCGCVATNLRALQRADGVWRVAACCNGCQGFDLDVVRSAAELIRGAKESPGTRSQRSCNAIATRLQRGATGRRRVRLRVLRRSAALMRARARTSFGARGACPRELLRVRTRTRACVCARERVRTRARGVYVYVSGRARGCERASVRVCLPASERRRWCVFACVSVLARV